MSVMSNVKGCCLSLFYILQENFSSSMIQPSGSHLHSAVEDKQTCSSETVILHENNPSFPATMKSASDEHGATRVLTLTQSLACSLSQKPYNSSLYAETAIPHKDGNLKCSECENSVVCKHRYSSLINNSESFSNVKQVKSSEISNYRLKFDKKPNDKEPEVVGMTGLIPSGNVLDSENSVNAEKRTRQVEKILSELASWRKKQSNIQTVQYNSKGHIPNKRKGRADCKKLHQKMAASDTLISLIPKHCDSLPRQQEIPDTSNSCSLGSHCK